MVNIKDGDYELVKVARKSLRNAQGYPMSRGALDWVEKALSCLEEIGTP